MLALLDPSRQEIPEYAEYLGAVHRAARSVNDAHGRDGWNPIDLRVSDNFPRAVAAYKRYDVLLVNAIVDGMNLIAKEAPLVNERDGVVILSENAGAHEELGRHALTVNPSTSRRPRRRSRRPSSCRSPSGRRGRRASATTSARMTSGSGSRASSGTSNDAERGAMTDPLLIVAALNGTRSRAECPKVPLTADELAGEARRCVDAGAAIVHVHARKPDGSPAFDLSYDDIVTPSGRRRRADLDHDAADAADIAGDDHRALRRAPRPPGAGHGQRAPDRARPPAHREEARQILEACDRAGVRPGADRDLARRTGRHRRPLQRLPARPRALPAARARPDRRLRLGADRGDAAERARMADAAQAQFSRFPWIAFGQDEASPVVCAVAAAAGGHVRVGFEDTATLPDGSQASSNAQLVELAASVAESLGRPVMDPSEARDLLR
jgi:uncharacterized protein (DUF849 family)